MKVQLVYRNYKPLHKIYESLVANPPNGVEYIVPPTLNRYKKLYKLYRKIRYLPMVPALIHWFERHIFLRSKTTEDPDIIHFINITGQKIPDKPYLVDIEHAASLISFVPNEHKLTIVKSFLEHANCKAVNCLSQAAKRTLKELLADDFKKIEDKVNVIYPALQSVEKENLKADYRYLSSADLNVLFVGDQAYLKGLEETLEALKRINQNYSPKDIALHVVSKDGGELTNRFKLPNVSLYNPNFSKQEIMTQFFMPADIYLLPTKQETFGMAVLDSLDCGTAVVASKQFAIPELISDSVDGILLKVNKPLMDSVLIPGKADMAAVNSSNLNQATVERIYQILSKLIDKKIDVKKMGRAGQQKFEDGNKFSISRRNKNLKAVYDSALKN